MIFLRTDSMLTLVAITTVLLRGVDGFVSQPSLPTAGRKSTGTALKGWFDNIPDLSDLFGSSELERVKQENQKLKEEYASELFGLHEEYEAFKASAITKQIEFKSEIVELKSELRKQVSSYARQIEALKDDLRETKKDAKKKTRFLSAIAEAKQAKLRNEKDAIEEELEALQAPMALQQKVQEDYEKFMKLDGSKVAVQTKAGNAGIGSPTWNGMAP